ncbi:Conserved oligomeric Golgi complex subunit-like protein [Hapsidospora chrysogenum ATCC 11550]|uniref:Conserved oligomeric Golgi complex subunit 1 n=1 Tax=Hapsidospora chrysogenum (strain ATCC 11550 / CBS 779.69 / DSM 880 / IAM 14645 / JCM 23072 / IMI 49137) TaxID=857340 RepID=A0A086T6E2_HAPC1|nr:Conserved oligomeric Golgi complex subunit-like protein [Hapsidospora chrysogenum ATCC 11550]
MSTPDPSTLTSSADIFSGGHTLPQIRAIHKSLHVAVDDKASRLRTQVGNSYRELLGTADTIVRMRGDNENVQELLGGMGARCGRTVVGAKASGLAGFVRGADGARGQVDEAARVRLLDACGLVVGRVLRGGGGSEDNVKKGDRLVLAAKVLVLSRLLLKNLGEELSDERLRPDIETAKKLLGSLRRRLLRNVDKVLDVATEDSDRENVVKALCAYSLATSSGAKDVLRHFLHVRGEAVALTLEVDEASRGRRTEDVMHSLRLYTRTLLDVQAVVPSRLSQALAALKSQPLLADPALKQLHGLRLDIYGRWCGEEIQYFTPFIRHEDLDGRLARDMLSKWAARGGEVLLGGLKATLDEMTEFKSIMELRTSVLQLWIRDGGRARGFDPSEMQDELREAINARMLAVLESKVKKLHLVGSEVRATLDTWRDGVTDKNGRLWDEEGYKAALSQGAAPFVEEVATRLYGRNDAVSKASNCYKSWFQVIDDVREVVESLRAQRWDNDFDEIEDEETIEARQQALSRDDPRKLQAKLDTALDQSFEELQGQLQGLWEARADGDDDGDDTRSGAVAMYFLRVLRDIRRQLPERPATASFGLGMVPSLHSKVAMSVSKAPLQDFADAGLGERSVPGRPLWEGEPALPSQPSPGVFEFLRNLCTGMGDAGMDLWSPAAVGVMKKHLDERLAGAWRDALAQVESEAKDGGGGKKGGHEDGEGETEKKKDDDDDDDVGDENHAGKTREKEDLHIQWYFDMTYLAACLGSDREGVKKVAEEVWEKTDLLDKDSQTRITKAAEAFWQRTNLLFGLLA